VKGAEQKTPRKAAATPKPYYRLVTPDQWEKNKQNEGTYRLDHTAWRGEQPEFRTPFAVRGNKIGAMKDNGNLNLRIPGWSWSVVRSPQPRRRPTRSTFPFPETLRGRRLAGSSCSTAWPGCSGALLHRRRPQYVPPCGGGP
jgi:hypothetical protein